MYNPNAMVYQNVNESSAYMHLLTSQRSKNQVPTKTRTSVVGQTLISYYSPTPVNGIVREANFIKFYQRVRAKQLDYGLCLRDREENLMTLIPGGGTIKLSINMEHSIPSLYPFPTLYVC